MFTMIHYRFVARWTSLFGLAGFAAALTAADHPVAPAPQFAEVYSLLRSNMTGATEIELNRAAVVGLLAQLQTKATLVTNGAGETAPSTVPLVSKSTVFEKAYGFLRVGRVASGLAQDLGAACQRLASSNKLEGLIMDLRFAVGEDYRAAAEAADLFVKTEQPLLNWGDVTVSSTSRNTDIELPLVILINRETTAAAEALAAALRQAEGSLIIGSPSAGRAYVFQDLPLSNGQKLRVASGSITAGRGQPLLESGIVPDIRIAVRFEDEKAYFEDPYKVLSRPFAQSVRATNDLAFLQGTNRARRRLNEAELVRMQREGVDFEAEQLSAGSPQPSGPVVSDPALSRALDLLKGLALAMKRQ